MDTKLHLFYPHVMSLASIMQKNESLFLFLKYGANEGCKFMGINISHSNDQERSQNWYSGKTPRVNFIRL